jgi:hypothetical protein
MEIRTCVLCSRTRARIHLHVRAHIRPSTSPSMKTRKCTRAHKHSHTCLYTYIREHMYAACLHTYIHTYAHICTVRIYFRTYIHTFMQTYTHTYTCIPAQVGKATVVAIMGQAAAAQMDKIDQVCGLTLSVKCIIAYTYACMYTQTRIFASKLTDSNMCSCSGSCTGGIDCFACFGVEFVNVICMYVRQNTRIHA